MIAIFEPINQEIIFNKEKIDNTYCWGFGLLRTNEDRVYHVIEFKDRLMDAIGSPSYKNNLTLFNDDFGNRAKVSDEYADRLKVPTTPYIFYVSTLNQTYITYDLRNFNDNYFYNRDVQFRLVSLDSTLISKSFDVINQKNVNLGLIKMNSTYQVSNPNQVMPKIIELVEMYFEQGYKDIVMSFS